jgi:malate synthase
MQQRQTSQVLGDAGEAGARILTPDALAFVTDLQREFNETRLELLAARTERQWRISAGELPDFLAETRAIREDPKWRVAPAPRDLLDRRVEITGPVDRKMVINALNSGARMFMADFEDSNAPTWRNCVEGQANLIDAVDHTISLDTGEKRYRLQDEIATLLVRPRGWHLRESHLLVDGTPVSASLFDFGLYLFHCGQRQLDAGSGPYFYLPKLESHLEARLWNDVFLFAQEQLSIPRGTIRATVLIETILAAFEMDEILYELREHSAGLNAGRWDYMFSIIKKFSDRPEFVLPDRPLVTMSVPFMRAYTELLVKTCHRHGAHAIGGMAAFIPSRRDPEVNEIALTKVREDKLREAGDGFDGTWVAHPDLVLVAMGVFDDVLGERPNQVDRLRDDVVVAAGDLLDVAATPGEVTEEGVRLNVSVGIQYIASWLNGVGAAAINNLMEDAATAEISRSQIWQWVRHGRVSREQVLELQREELEKLGPGYEAAAEVFAEVALAGEFAEFLTLPAYERLVAREASCISDPNMAADPALHLNLPSVVAEHPFLALVHEPRENYVLCTAETAECTCPEFCERDHDRD